MDRMYPEEVVEDWRGQDAFDFSDLILLVNNVS